LAAAGVPSTQLSNEASRSSDVRLDFKSSLPGSPRLGINKATSGNIAVAYNVV
jgi:hypothetical protein